VEFFGLAGVRSPLAGVAGPIVAATQPVVAPFQEVVPALRIAGGVLETYTLVAIVAVYLVAGLVGQLFVRR
jgi:YGGT family